MIDFQNGILVKLKLTKNDEFSETVSQILIDGESILFSYKTIRDGVVFTNKRIITFNFKGITGTSVDISSLPYSKIQAFSVETTGAGLNDAKLELWFSGLGKVKLEFIHGTDVRKLCKLISKNVL